MTGIGAEGAASVARALESGRCSLTSLDLGCEWGALVLRVAYHRAALYRCAVLGCCQLRFVGRAAPRYRRHRYTQPES